jgi:hypothetical protein
MTLGEEHVPETKLASLVLQILNDGWVAFPSGIALASKGFNYRVGTIKDQK